MRIYVAASYLDRVKAREIMTALEAAGHEITLDWTQPYDLTDASMASQAERERDAVERSDTYVGLLPGRLGFHVELGLALGQKTSGWRRGRTILIGKRDEYVTEPEKERCLFYRLPMVEWADDVAGVLALLEAS